jgi:hypothetical protein
LSQVCPGVSGSPDEIDATHGGHDGCFNPHWRTPLYIQAAGMAAFAPIFHFVDGQHLNCKGGEAGRVLHAARSKLYMMLKLQLLAGPAPPDCSHGVDPSCGVDPSLQAAKEVESRAAFDSAFLSLSTPGQLDELVTAANRSVCTPHPANHNPHLILT